MYISWNLVCKHLRLFCTKINLSSKNSVYLKGRDKEIFYLLIHSPDEYIRQSWGRPKLGVRRSILVPHMDGIEPSTWAATFHIPRNLNRRLSRDSKLCCDWDATALSTFCFTTHAPKLLIQLHFTKGFWRIFL